MGFWNYLGLASLLQIIFDRKKNTYSPPGRVSTDLHREMMRDELYFQSQKRLDQLETRLNELEKSNNGKMRNSSIYNSLQDDIEELRDELDFLEEDLIDEDDFDDPDYY